jgi:hypothetical protein
MSSKAHRDYFLSRAWPGGPTFNELDYAERRIVNRIAREMNQLDKMAAEDPRLHSHHHATHITARQGMYGRQNYTDTSHNKATQHRNKHKPNASKGKEAKN